MVERPLRMRKAPGSIPGTSTAFFLVFFFAFLRVKDILFSEFNYFGQKIISIFVKLLKFIKKNVKTSGENWQPFLYPEPFRYSVGVEGLWVRE